MAESSSMGIDNDIDMGTDKRPFCWESAEEMLSPVELRLVR